MSLSARPPLKRAYTQNNVSFQSQQQQPPPQLPDPRPRPLWLERARKYAWIFIQHVSKHTGVGIVCAVAYFDP